MIFGGRVSVERLLLLWTACLALSTASLGDDVFALPLVLLLSVVASLVVVVLGRDIPGVSSPVGAVVPVMAVLLALVPLTLFLLQVLDVPLAPLLIGLYAATSLVTGLASWKHQWTFAVFLAGHVVLVAMVMRDVTVVADVRALVDGGAKALLHGTSPYSITVPRVYEHEFDWFYGPDVLVDGRITYGYPYLPLPLLVVLPAYLMGDIRFALVLASVATAVLIRRMATDQLGRLCAVLVLILPVSWAMDVSFWIEPIMGLWVALMALAMTRGSSSVAVWFGCFLASKQFAIVQLPLLWTLVRRHGRRAALVALSISAALCLVFFLWDPRAFFHSVVEFHIRQPYRPDTVTLTPAFVRLIGGYPGFLDWPFGFAIGGCASALIAWRRRPGAEMLAAGVGLSLALAVLFSKQGHANYWGLIGTSLLIAVAVRPSHEPAVGVRCP